MSPAPSKDLAPADQERLLRAARDSIQGMFLGTAPPSPPVTLEGEGDPLSIPAVAFVTLEIEGRLRGCIGRIRPEGDLSLLECVRRMAVSAASRDPRFPPLKTPELDQIHIEISVLGPMVEISPEEIDRIEPGTHGIHLTRGARTGLLLPQVASDHGWDVPTFLLQTCRKARLPDDAWRSGTIIEIFTAQVFREADERGDGPLPDRTT